MDPNSEWDEEWRLIQRIQGTGINQVALKQKGQLDEIKSNDFGGKTCYRRDLFQIYKAIIKEIDMVSNEEPILVKMALIDQDFEIMDPQSWGALESKLRIQLTPKQRALWTSIQARALPCIRAFIHLIRRVHLMTLMFTQ